MALSRKWEGLFYFYDLGFRGFEAKRALTKCQKSGQRWPRKRAEGSLRRKERDANDVVGESPWGRHTGKASSEKSEEAFSFSRLALGWFFLLRS